MLSPVPSASDSFAPTHPSTDAPPQQEPEGEPTVMVIDDSMAVRTILEASFHRVGVQVSAYADGIAAIQALTRGDVPVPNVLLLDIGLPRMDGYEVARILRGHEQFGDTTILMLTGRDGIVDRVKSRWVGAREYIKKPFRVSDVVRTVCIYLRISVPGISEPPGGPRG